MSKLSSISTSLAHSILHQLELALIAHDIWLAGWNRGMIFRTPDRIPSIESDSHHRCHFGKWLDSIDQQTRKLPIFQEIIFLHKRMHETGNKALQHVLEGGEPSPTDYDELMVRRTAFRLHAELLKHQIQDDIFQIDPLTQTYNRAKMMPTLEREFSLLQQGSGRHSTIAMTDLDYFKKVNDNYGHSAGDAVLREVALFFRTNLRPTDLVFRFGGEEFLLYLSGMALSDAENILNRLREQLSELPIPVDDKITLNVTGSFGVSSLGSAESVKEAIDRADEALYQAKGAGRNRVITFEN
ncbi:diguanylate cyclase [Magnetococcales bacterium HHB-1]